jgi:hypothetical protein
MRTRKKVGWNFDERRRSRRVKVSRIEPTASAGEVVWPYGPHIGRTVAEVWNSGASGRAYIKRHAELLDDRKCELGPHGPMRPEGWQRRMCNVAAAFLREIRVSSL